MGTRLKLTQVRAPYLRHEKYLGKHFLGLQQVVDVGACMIGAGITTTANSERRKIFSVSKTKRLSHLFVCMWDCSTKIRSRALTGLLWGLCCCGACAAVGPVLLRGLCYCGAVQLWVLLWGALLLWGLY